MQVTVRPDVGQEAVEELVAALSVVPWADVQHAYGAASDVPALLFAVTVGTEESRGPAWWELWGNVHHQGTVYEATVPSVPFVQAVARSVGHPDRVEALDFLRQAAIANGDFAADVRAAVQPRAAELVAAWESEPEDVRRALVWLSSVYPELASQNPGLIRLVPEPMRSIWDEVVARSGYPPTEPDDRTDEAMEREDELEAWALAGWPGH